MGFAKAGVKALSLNIFAILTAKTISFLIFF